VKPVLKILLGLLGLVVVIAVALAIAVALLFDPKDYQPLLAGSVERATGRKFTLEGDLGLDFFPCCAVTLERAALGNPPGFPEGEFASVESAALSLKVWPLITRREVGIGTVRLQGLNANLLVRADGAANWEFAESAEAPAGAPAGEAGPGRLAIEGIEIRGGRVSYEDEQEKSAYLAEDLELDTGDVTPGEPFDLALSTKVTDQADGTTGTVTLKASATLDPGFELLTLEKPLIGIAAAGKSIPAKSLEATVGAAALAIEAKEDTVFQFRRLECDFTLPGLEAAAGDFSGTFTAGDARLSVGASTELTLPVLEADLTLSGREIPGDTITARVQSGPVALDVDKGRGSIEKLSADVNGLGARLGLTAAGRIAEGGANLAGTLKLEPLSPRSVLAVLKEPAPVTADPEALTRFSGTADWELAKDSLKLPKLDFRLDQTQLTGSLGFEGFEEPLTRFDLALDAIDLDRYLAPDAGEADGKGAATAGEGAAAAEDIPVETIRDLKLDGRVRIEKLTFAQAKLTDVRTTLRADGGRLRLDPLAASLYGGEYRGAVTIDATAPVAKLAFDQQLAALQVGSVLKELYQNDKLTGALTGRINASATGNTTEALLRSLAGNVAVSLADGAYLGTDLWHEIRKARALIRGDAPPPAPVSPKTKLNSMEVAGNIADGVLRTERLLAEIPFIRLDGAGALNLVDRTMDYRLQAQVFETPTFEDGTTIRDLKGLTIPLTLSGAMDKPKVSVDLKNMATGVATQKLRERLLEKLGGDEPAPSEGEQAAPAEPPKEEKPRDILKRGLRDLLK
jgi:AsmA protein